MYRDLARWWPLLSPLEDYVEEANAFWQLLQDAGVAEGGTLLELGSGGGHNAAHLKRHFKKMTLSDLSPDMLAVSQALNPDCEHVVADMRQLRLGQTFDAVLVHDAIEYMTSLDDLARAFETAWTHLRPGGVALFVPDGVRDHFKSHSEHGGHDDGQRGIRYLEWVYDPDEKDSTCVADYVLILREPGQPVEVVHEQHVYGNFYRDEWLQALNAQGFETHTSEDAWDRVVFIAKRPEENS